MRNYRGTYEVLVVLFGHCETMRPQISHLEILWVLLFAIHFYRRAKFSHMLYIFSLKSDMIPHGEFKSRSKTFTRYPFSHILLGPQSKDPSLCTYLQCLHIRLIPLPFSTVDFSRDIEVSKVRFFFFIRLFPNFWSSSSL